MEYIKNKTSEVVTISSLGVELHPNEERLISEFANRSKLQDYASSLIDLIYSDKVIITDADRFEFTKVESVQYISSAYLKVKVDYEASKERNNYYFLKDTFNLKKNETIEKLFRGRVKFLRVISSNSTIDIQITTGDGLVLPADDVIKREELAFNFDGDMKDPILKITAEGVTDVDIFMEGFNNDMEPKDLQTFIDTWYKNEEMWTSQNAVILMVKDNASDVDSPSLIQSSTGNTLVIPDKRYYKTGYYYRIYKITDNEFFIEYLENNNWSIWNPNRYAVRVKNIRYIQFTDKTIDVKSTDLLIPYEDYQFDKSSH